MDLTSLTPIEGGRSGETFLGEVGGDRCVVRIYARPGDRGDAAAEIDAALLRLVRGLVPVPDVLEVRRPDAATGVPGLLVTSWVPGVRGDVLLPGLGAEDLARVGHALGSLAATLAGMPALRGGRFVDGDLTVEAREEHPDAVSPEESLALLDTVSRRTLVHGDLGLANVLLDPATLSVTAVVDWERAHAGHPFTDLGRLLRDQRAPTLVEAVLGAWCDRHGGTPDRALALAEAADVVAGAGAPAP